jgi:hypothetical protein
MFLCCKLFAKILGEKDHKHINLDKARVVESEYLENVTDKHRRFKKNSVVYSIQRFNHRVGNIPTQA